MQKTKIKAFDTAEDYIRWDCENCAKCLRGIDINDGNIDFRCTTQKAIYEQSVGITEETTVRSIVLTSKPTCDSLSLKQKFKKSHVQQL